MDSFKVQVEDGHYSFEKYVSFSRWASYYNQIFEVIKTGRKNVLWIGVGDGIVTEILKKNNINITTVDIDPKLQPDIIASITDLPILGDSFDVVCAFQVLEHMPYNESLKGLSELLRVAKYSTLISLPNQKPCRKFYFSFPYIRNFQFLIEKICFQPKNFHFDGEHYWELNAKGYESDKVIKDILSINSVKNTNHYRLFDNPYHHFIIIECKEK